VWRILFLYSCLSLKSFYIAPPSEQRRLWKMMAEIHLYIVITLHQHCAIFPRQWRLVLHLILLCRTPLFHNHGSARNHRIPKNFEISEKFPTSLERWPKLCPAIGNKSFPFANNLLLVFWSVNVFTGRGTSRYRSYFRCFSKESLGNTAVYHSTWPTPTN
jgi:hypothetical protein